MVELRVVYFLLFTCLYYLSFLQFGFNILPPQAYFLPVSIPLPPATPCSSHVERPTVLSCFTVCTFTVISSIKGIPLLDKPNTFFKTQLWRPPPSAEFIIYSLLWIPSPRPYYDDLLTYLPPFGSFEFKKDRDCPLFIFLRMNEWVNIQVCQIQRESLSKA